MYITINNVIGEKRIGLSYPIHPRKEVAIISMISDNVQCQVKEDTRVLPLNGKEVKLSGGLYTDEALDSLIGSEKDKLVPCGHALKVNKLGKVTKMIISLNELDNIDNLEDGRPSDVLFTYHVTDNSKDVMSFEPKMPQNKKLKNHEIVSLTIKIMDQANNIMANGPGTT